MRSAYSVFLKTDSGYIESNHYLTVEKALSLTMTGGITKCEEQGKMWIGLQLSLMSVLKTLRPLSTMATSKYTFDILLFLPHLPESLDVHVFNMYPSSRNDHFMLNKLLFTSFNYRLGIGQFIDLADSKVGKRLFSIAKKSREDVFVVVSLRSVHMQKGLLGWDRRRVAHPIYAVSTHLRLIIR